MNWRYEEKRQSSKTDPELDVTIISRQRLSLRECLDSEIIKISSRLCLVSLRTDQPYEKGRNNAAFVFSNLGPGCPIFAVIAGVHCAFAAQPQVGL